MTTATRLISLCLVGGLVGGLLALATCGDSGGGAAPGPGDGGGALDLALSGDLAGSRSDDAATSGDGAASCTGSPTPDCAACLKISCNAEVTACFGATWQTMDAPNSVCSGVPRCTCECQDKGGKDCLPTCGMQRGMMCSTCLTAALACLNKNCSTRCQ